jgi:hypothetical protein
MISKNTHQYWTDAKHEASELSMKHGHAWIRKSKGFYRVRYSKDVDGAPKNFVTEFKDGIQQ